MRARKKVLLYCADEELGSTIALVLGVRCRYTGATVTVTSTSTPRDFLAESIAEGAKFDCVVVIRSELDSEGDRQVLALLRGEPFGMLAVEVMNGMPPIADSCTEKRVYTPVKAGMSEIVEMVRLACTRKRGPKGCSAERYSYQLAMIGQPATVVA